MMIDYALTTPKGGGVFAMVNANVECL